MSTERVTDQKFVKSNRKKQQCKICLNHQKSTQKFDDESTSTLRRSKRLKRSFDDDKDLNEMNKVYDYGRTLLHTAVAQSDVDWVKWLISRGFDPLVETEEEASLLWFAVQAGCVHVAQVLIDHGVYVKKRIDYESCLVVTMRKGNLNMAEFLLRNGIDINEPLYHYLFLAVQNQKYKFLPLLLKYGANVQGRNENFESIVHEAVRYFKTPKILDFLVEKGADVNAMTKEKESPLHYAANKDCTYFCFWEKRVMRLWQYAFYKVVSYESIHVPNCIEKLIEYGAKVNAKNTMGQTPLHLAVNKGCAYKVQQLLDAGAEVDVKDENGNTPLIIAVVCYRHVPRRLMRQLLVAGADPKQITNKSLLPEFERDFAEFLIAKRVAGLSYNERLLGNIEMDDKLRSYQEKCIKEVAYMEKVVLENKELTLLSFLRANSRRSAFYGFKETEFINFITEEHYEELPIYRDMLEQKFVTVTRHLPVREKAVDSLNDLLQQRLPTEVLEKIIDKLDVDNLKKVIKANNK